MGSKLLIDVIRAAQSFDGAEQLFVPEGVAPAVDTPVEIRDFGNEPAPAEGQRYFLGLEQVQDVVDALREELPDPSDDQLVQAVVYYSERDAFIDPSLLTIGHQRA